MATETQSAATPNHKISNEPTAISTDNKMIPNIAQTHTPSTTIILASPDNYSTILAFLMVNIKQDMYKAT